MKRITIGTRASKLAMIQTNWVLRRLHEQWADLDIAIEQISTKGDHIMDKPFTQIGGDGVFVMEIEHALAERRIDLAVHSLKDLPTAQPDGLRVFAIGEREDVRDVIIWNSAMKCSGTPCGSQASEPASGLRIGTCSLRRTAQVRALFQHVEILPLRGNVDTRLRKLDAGDYDGIVLAAAGLHRLEVHQPLINRMNYLPVDVMMPAPGQGALAVEIRDEPEMQALMAPLVERVTEATTGAERMFMRRLGAGCYLPVAAYAGVASGLLTLQGLVISLDGQQKVHVRQSIAWTPESKIEDAVQLGVRVAEQALAQGGDAIIDAIDVVRGQAQEHQHV